MASYIFGTFLTLIGPKRENSLNLISFMAYTVEAMIHLLRPHTACKIIAFQDFLSFSFFGLII